MAQRSHTLDLKAPDFSLLYRDHPATVLRDSDGGLSDSAGLPSIAYMHNVMPTLKGVDSVAYKSVISVISPALTTFTDVRVIYGSAKTRLYLGFTTDNKIYVLKSGAVSWLLLALAAPTSAENVTIARADGVSYIYFKQVGCYKYNEATDVLDPVTLTSLDPLTILGIVGSYGYLITYTETEIAWSSTLDPTDFTPSEVTGAGSGAVVGIGGAIQFILPNSLGWIAYTTTNAVAGTFTGNVQYPFKLKEIDNSKGADSLDLIAYEANATEHFAYTSGGFQALTSREATVLLPEVTDFLAGKVLEDFDEATNVFSITDLVATMKKKVKFIASRYLVISYGISTFTHALVYDTALKRLGKLKFTHVDCFEYIGAQKELSKESIAFALKTGEVKTLDFSVASNSTGVLILGKLQYNRNKMLVMQELEVENVKSTSTFNIVDLYTLDGKTIAVYNPVLIYTGAEHRKYGFSITAVNHSFVFVGKFNLNTVFVKYNLGGNR